jgi:hypothetical protein
MRPSPGQRLYLSEWVRPWISQRQSSKFTVPGPEYVEPGGSYSRAGPSNRGLRFRCGWPAPGVIEGQARKGVVPAVHLVTPSPADGSTKRMACWARATRATLRGLTYPLSRNQRAEASMASTAGRDEYPSS